MSGGRGSGVDERLLLLLQVSFEPLKKLALLALAGIHGCGLKVK
jgi:hypothetical protein